MAEVLLRDVVKKYDSVDAVKRLNLCCNDKEFLVLLGPSGCGKSSTLRMIAGLEDITQGQISIDGVVVNDIHPSKRDIAMVFETYALYPHKTVYENMAYPLRVRKTPDNVIDQKVQRAAEILEIEGFLDRYPRQLSGGQKQRVAIGRAIVREPKVFLMDEPISHLDAKLRSHMRGELKHLHKELNQTFIYVSHDQTEAMAMADRIAVMNFGELQQFDTSQNIFNKPANTFVAGFVGDPPMNFLPSLLSQSGDRWALKFEGFTLKVSEKLRSQIIASGVKFQQDMEVILGARPEHIILKREKTGEEDMAGKIYITEPLGSYMIVDVMLGGKRIKVRTDISFDVQPDDRVFVEFPPDKIQLFDAKTSYSIIHPRSSTECEAG